MRNHPRRGLTVLLTAAAVLASATVANAKIVDRGEFTDDYSFTEVICEDTSVGGLDIDVIGEFRGTFQVRADIPDSTAYLWMNRWEFREVVTNPENGKWLVIRGKGVAKDVTATHLEGNIYRYRIHDAGQLFVMESSDGRVVQREVGVEVVEVDWETLSVDPYQGQFIDFRWVSSHGPRVSEEQFCQAAAALIG